MNTRLFRFCPIVITALLLQLGAVGTMAGDPGNSKIDWEALNPDIKGATYTKSSSECVECHEEYIRTYAMTKMGRALPDGGCESCHGPMSKHMDAPRQKPALVVSQKNLTPEQGNAICTQCHQEGLQMNWPVSAHAAAGNTCTDCHNIMSVDDPVRDKLTQTKICFKCHQDKRAQTRTGLPLARTWQRIRSTRPVINAIRTSAGRSCGNTSQFGRSAPSVTTRMDQPTSAC